MESGQDMPSKVIQVLRLLHKSYSSYPQVNISPQNQA